MPKRVIKRRRLIEQLHSNGFEFVRYTDGSHKLYKGPNGQRTVIRNFKTFYGVHLDQIERQSGIRFEQ